MKDGKHVILCVDDDADLLESMRIVLEAKGYLLVTASSAEAGLVAFHAAQPDFILVDLMMEEIDSGTGFAQSLRLAGNTAPVYMLSSVGDHLNLSTDYNALGLSGVFQKPVGFDILLRTIESKLG
jgi:DNA-binding response OmpR family regulator